MTENKREDIRCNIWQMLDMASSILLESKEDPRNVFSMIACNRDDEYGILPWKLSRYDKNIQPTPIEKILMTEQDVILHILDNLDDFGDVIFLDY